jgi:transcriptional regulator GlxA family with amidase domain
MDPRLVVVVGYPDAELLDIAGITSSLVVANDFGGAQPPYEVVVATPGGRPITCPPGLTLHGQHALERITGPLDTVVVSGGRGCEAAADDPALVADLRRIARRSRRVASVCTGASILAATGCSMVAAPLHTGATPVGSPPATPRSPSTPVPSTSGTETS